MKKMKQKLIEGEWKNQQEEEKYQDGCHFFFFFSDCDRTNKTSKRNHKNE